MEKKFTFYNEAITMALRSELMPKIGAVIVDNDNIVSEGFSKLGEGIELSNDLIEGDEEFIIHGEVDAISKLNGNADGMTMYVAGKCPCVDCANVIVAAGIKEVHCPPPDNNSKWVISNREALDLFDKSGVKVIIDMTLAGIELGLTCYSKYGMNKIDKEKSHE